MEEEYDVEVEWLPFELHPGIPPEGKELPEYVRRGGNAVEQRLLGMAQEAGLPMVRAERMINSRKALEASEYAREQGKHAEFHRVVFRKFYGEGQDMFDWAVLRAAAEEVGLDPDEMQARTDAGDFSGVVTDAIRVAVGKGIRGVPAYVFADKYLISGAQPYEIFRRAMDALGVEPIQNGDEY